MFGSLIRFIYVLSLFFSLSGSLSAASWWADEEYNQGTLQVSVGLLAESLLEGETLFIDTRELEEFQGGHIPGAIHLQLKDVAGFDIVQLRRYTYVVPYCVKDFRGYEVARALMSKGSSNVVMMAPAGLKGWKSEGLPIGIDTDAGLRNLADIFSGDSLAKVRLHE